MTTPSVPDSPIEHSLYDALGEPVPATVAAGETKLTATKETVDADTEDVSDDDILNL
jgi:hypothetical protein